MPRECIVCGEEVKPDANKFDDKKPVEIVGEDKVYHLGCESEYMDEIHCKRDDE